MPFLPLISVCILLLSYITVNVIRQWAERKQLLAIPNERSSHIRPTPSGGGLAIVVFSLLGLLEYLFICNRLSLTVGCYVIGACMITLINWFDDLYTVPNRWRFGVQSLSALLVLWGVGYWQTIATPISPILHLHWFGLLLSFIWLVGFTNAYNFMDGIDGLAGSQAVIAGIGWMVWGWWIDQPFVLALGCFIAISSLGFLGHNWAPAKIFMGNVGSAFLGFSFAVLSIVATQSEPRLWMVGFLLVWPFIFDTAFTILRRLRNGENIFAAHRSHLYQRLVITGHSHSTVTALYSILAGTGLLFSMTWFDTGNGNASIQLVIFPLMAVGLWFLVINQEQWKKRISTITSLSLPTKIASEPNGEKTLPRGSLQSLKVNVK